MNNEQIKHMVDRFLGWRLPKDFNPDCGISFDRKYQDNHSPTGTNVFDATQADGMVRHMIDGLPICEPVAWRWRHANSDQWVYDPSPEWREDMKDEPAIVLEPLYSVHAPCKMPYEIPKVFR